MIIRWTQTFNAMWTLKGKSDNAKYDVEISIEGPERALMTDAGPIIEEINGLEGKNLSKHIGRSSLEAVVLHVRDIVKKHLDSRDKVKKVCILENDMFAAEV